jgi:hypothetical protein
MKRESSYVTVNLYPKARESEKAKSEFIDPALIVK